MNCNRLGSNADDAPLPSGLTTPVWQSIHCFAGVMAHPPPHFTEPFDLGGPMNAKDRGAQI